jgi:large repetitive protein
MTSRRLQSLNHSNRMVSFVRNGQKVICVLGFIVALFGTRIQAQDVFATGLVQSFASGFANPDGVAVDPDGNLFVADCNNNSIKEITPDGHGAYPAPVTVITLINLSTCPKGIAIDSHRNLFVAVNSAVLELSQLSGYHSSTLVPSSGLSVPEAVAVDAHGDVFVADAGNKCVEEILAVNGVIPPNPTMILFGRGQMQQVSGIAIDSRGDVFVADPQSSAVDEIVAVNGVIPGSAVIKLIKPVTNAFYRPMGVAVDANGNLFVSETTADIGGVLKKVLATTVQPYDYISVQVVQNGLTNPEGVAIDSSGRVFVADSGHNRVTLISLPPLFLGGVNAGSSSSVFSISFGYYASDDPPGPIYILNLDPSHPEFTDAGTSTCKAKVNTYPGNICTVDILFKPLNPGLRLGAIDIEDGLGQQLALVNLTGASISSPTAVGPALSGISGLAVDSGGDIFFSDPGNNTVNELSASGQYATVQPIGVAFNSPGQIAVDKTGNLYVCDVQAPDMVVKEISASSQYQTARKLATVENCNGLAVDQQGNVYVSGVLQLMKITAVGGSIPASPTVTQVPNLASTGPIAVDSQGDIFVWPQNQNLLQEALASGAYSDIKTIAPVYLLMGLATDNSGDVYLSNGYAIEELVQNGSYTTQVVLANGLNSTTGLGRDLQGNLYTVIESTSFPPSFQIVKLAQSNPTVRALKSPGPKVPPRRPVIRNPH